MFENPLSPQSTSSDLQEQDLQERRLRRRYLTLGLLIGMIIGVPIILFLIGVGADQVTSLATTITVILLVVGVLLFLVIRYRDRIVSYVFGKTKADNEALIEYAVRAMGAQMSQERDPKAFEENSIKLLKGLAARYSWLRFQRWLFGTAVVLVGGFGTLLGSVLLFQQLERLDTQNSRLAAQNQLITQQNQLLLLQKEIDSAQLMLNQRQLMATITQNDLFAQQNGLAREQNQLVGYQNNLVRGQTRRLDSQLAIMGVQNMLIDSQLYISGEQNALVGTQNYRIKVQTHLMEAERRSSLVFLMSNVLDKMDEEIKEQKRLFEQAREDKLISGSNSFQLFTLSNELIARIVALSQAFQPYFVLEGDSLSKVLTSPERGQLFIALMKSELESGTKNRIIKEGNFSYAQIGDKNFANTDFKSIALEGADFSGVNLSRTNFSGANLRKVNFKDTKLIRADLSFADLRGAVNLTVDQLITTSSLYRTKIDSLLYDQLQTRDTLRCLFDFKGCDGRPIRNKDASDYER